MIVEDLLQFSKSGILSPAQVQKCWEIMSTLTIRRTWSKASERPACQSQRKLRSGHKPRSWVENVVAIVLLSRRTTTWSLVSSVGRPPITVQRHIKQGKAKGHSILMNLLQAKEMMANKWQIELCFAYRCWPRTPLSQHHIFAMWATSFWATRMG